MNNIGSGFHCLLEGLKLIFKSGLRRFVVIPTAINIALFILLFFLFKHYFTQFNIWFNHLLPSWLHWLSVILWIFFFISFFVFFVYTFVSIGNLVSAPFNSLLSERVEQYLTGVIHPDKRIIENVRDIPRTIVRQLAILGYYIPRAILIFILFLIPIIHVIAPFLWFLFSAWYLALTYIDYPTDNHRIPLTTARKWLNERRIVSLSFGICVLVMSMIPFLNFFAIPASVAGATKLWLEESKTG